MSKVRSRISKGRGFQKRVKDLFKAAFELDDDDIRTPIGAETGCDVKFSKKAQKRVGLSIECKDQKKISIWAAIEQAKKNAKNGETEAVVFKRGDLGAHKTCITIPLEHYLYLRKLLQAETD